MRYADIKELNKRLYFTVNDLAEVLGIKTESARVLCARNVRNRLFIRLKNNFYILENRWASLNRIDFLTLSNFLQVPSYVSLMTALTYYEVSTQVQQGYFESIAVKRTKRISAQGVEFVFYKLKQAYYFGFIKRDNIFIATKEKAIVDALYLYSFGKYKLDLSSIDFDKFDRATLMEIQKPYPQKTKDTIKKLCRI